MLIIILWSFFLAESVMQGKFIKYADYAWIKDCFLKNVWV